MEHPDWLFIRILLFLVLTLLPSCGGKSADGRSADRRVDFTVIDLDRNQQSFSQFRGKTVLINVWATWCAPCIKEIPDLQAVYDQRKDDGVVVLGVLLDSKNPEAARPMVEKLRITYPTWYGDDEFARQFEIAVFPTTFVVDTSGKIVYRIDGSMNKEGFEKALKRGM